jgi:tetratricopeptide (TPR) repeat protein
MIGYNLEEKQKQKKVCPKCNEEIDNKAKFCPNCGTKVSNDAEFYDDCIKEFIKKGTIDEFNSKISELDVEKDSAFIIKNTTIASNIFKFKIIKTIYSRAFAYIKEGNKDLAIYDFADIIKWCDDIFNDKHSNEIIAKENSLDVFYILSLIYKGGLLAELEEYDLAIKDLNSYLQIINEYYKNDIDSFKDDIFLAYFYRALSYSMLKDTQRAKLDIDKALELNPNDEDANDLYKAINDESNKNIDIKELITNIGRKIFS